MRKYLPLMLVVLGLAFASCKDPNEPNKTTYYTISFNANGGSGAVPPAQKVQDGSSVNLPNEGELSKTNYTFGGWSTKTSGADPVYPAGYSYMPVDDITLYAKWNINQYTVTYHVNGGSGTVPASQTVNAGSSVTLSNGSGLSRTGYTFGGWNTHSSGAGTNYNAGASYTPTGTISLYAKWNAAGITAYTVTYNINGGMGTTPAAQTVNPGDSVTLASGNVFLRSGYIFGGWSTNNSGTDPVYPAGFSYVPTGTITLYAKWDAAGTATYTVTYNINGGTGTTPDAQTVNAGNSVTLASGDDFSRSGYTFGGWNENQYGTGDNHIAGTTYVPTGSIILYAKWIEESQPHEHDSGTWHVALDATCAAPGTRELRCTSCNAVLNTQPIEALGHNWEWISTATETNDGIETEVCTHDNSHTGVTRIAYATGTSGLAFDLINSNTAYSVNKGTVTSGVVHIPAYYRPNLNSDYLPVTEIGDGAFYYCTSLTGISIPASVTSIGEYAFNSCTSLASITVNASNQTYTSQDGILYDKEKSNFIHIPRRVSGAITIPSGIISIDNNAFFECASLVTVTFAAGSQLETIGQQAFSGCTDLISITIPASVTSIGQQAFSGCTDLISITIPASVTSIGQRAFLGCTSLAAITIPANVTTISNTAFNGCSNLKNIVIDTDKVTMTIYSNWGIIFPANNLSVTFKKNIGDYAFNANGGNTRLISVTISEGVTFIGTSAFSRCSGLTDITIPASVTSIGQYAFYECTGLATISFTTGNQLKTIGVSAFFYCVSLTDITIPASVVSIDNSAFLECTNLVTVTFSAGSQLKTIGKTVFWNCTSLTNINIPAGVTSFGENAFDSCTSITSITIPASVTTIGNAAFAGWTNQQRINIEGYTSLAAADAAWGQEWNPGIWRAGCSAVFYYRIGNSWVQQ